LGENPGIDIGTTDGANIAIVIHDPLDRGKEETEANARIMKASPLLLEACKGVIDMLDGEYPCHPMSEKVREAINAAERG